MSNKEAFFALHTFNPALAGAVGAERELFIIENGVLVPRAPEVLSALSHDPRWTYELSACQVECRTTPTHDPWELVRELCELRHQVVGVARPLGLDVLSMEVAPATIPREVYPDPRYATLSTTLPEDRFLAALRVAGTHVHVGCANLEEAVRVHDALVEHLEELIALGNFSGGERIRLYERVTAPHTYPHCYGSVDAYYEDAVRCNFTLQLRNNWHLIRISRYGTVEVRAFGSPLCNSKVGDWAARIQEIRANAIR